MELGYSPALELGHSPALKLRYIPVLELRSSPALVLGCKRYLECNPALELRRKRTLPLGNNFKPEVWHKNKQGIDKGRKLKGAPRIPDI